MQEESLQPSERTLRLLVHVLYKNNIPIPFGVPSSSSFETVQSKTQIDKEKCTFDQFHLAIIRKDIRCKLNIGNLSKFRIKSITSYFAKAKYYHSFVN